MADAKPASKPQAKFAQKLLRDLGTDERVVRIAGLKFILPNQFKPGDVLDETAAIFINTAWHTAIINRFSPLREELLKDPRTTYDVFDGELQAFVDGFKWTPRPKKTSKDPIKLSEEEKALESFARPMFNKAMKGHGLPREQYEAFLREFIVDNRAMLEEAFARQKESVDSLIAFLDGDQPS